MIQPRDFPDTRPSLLVSLRNAPDEPAWREFFNRYAPAVFRVCRLCRLNCEDADDIVQQVMVAVASCINRFDYNLDRGRFRQWITRIANNKIHDLRRQADPPAETLDTAQCIDTHDGIDALWDREWRLQDIHFCLDEITKDIAPRRIEAFRLYVMEGLGAAETARRVGMTVGHVYVTRTLIIGKIRERIAALGQRETDARV